MKYFKKVFLAFTLFFAMILMVSCTKDNGEKEIKFELEPNMIAGFSYNYNVQLGSEAGSSYEIYLDKEGIVEFDRDNSKIIALAEGTVEVTILSDKNITLVVNLTIASPLEYTIEYELNEHSDIDTTNWVKSYNSASPEIDLPVPVKTGYTFGGWYENEECTGNAVTKIGADETGNKKFYAKWLTGGTYVITFNTMGGELKDSIEFNSETGYIEFGTVTREGYEFLGWSFFETGGQLLTGINAKDNLTNMTAYARWQIVSYTITYELDGGTLTGAVKKYTIEETVTLKDPTKDGYKFAGWYETADFNGEAITSLNNATGNKTLYAKWGDAYYTVSWNLNGGSWAGEEPQETFDINNSIDILPTPVKDGYTFLGWFENDLPVEELELKNYDLIAKWHSNSGETIYVSYDGYNSLAKALAVALDNDIIIVEAGSWEGGTVTQNNIKIIGANENINPNTANRVNESFITSDIIIEGNNVEINGIGLTKKGKIIVGNKAIENLAIRYLHVVDSTVNEASSDSAVAPVTLASKEGIKNVILTNSRYEATKGRAMIIYGYNIENLTVTNNVFLGTSSDKSLYNDGIKIDTDSVNGYTGPEILYGIKGNVLILGNTFSNYYQYTIWFREYGAGIFDILDNTFTNVGQSPTSHAVITTITPNVGESEKALFNVKYNIVNNGYLLARLENKGLTKDNFEAYVNYNIMNSSTGTVYVTNNSSNTLELIDAAYNYFGTETPNEKMFVGVSNYMPCYTTIDDIPSYEEAEGIYMINYELNGGKFNDSMPISYKKGVGVSDLGVPTRNNYVFDGWVDAEGNEVTSISAESIGKVKLFATWRENAIYVGSADYAYKTIAEALAKAEENGTIIIIDGTYNESFSISIKGLTIKGLEINDDVTLNKPVLTGKVTINADNVTLQGLSFTESSGISGSNISGFKFSNNYVFDTTRTTVEWKEAAESKLGWMNLRGSSNSTPIVNCEFSNNYFKNVGDTCIAIAYSNTATFYNNKFVDYLYDAIRYDNGGYNFGVLSFTNNEFIQSEQGAYTGIYFRIYGGSGQDTNIYIKGNTFKNIGFANSTSVYLGAISARNYQEKGAYIEITDNDFIECKNYIRIRNNGTAANHSASVWSCIIENNNFIGEPDSYYFVNKAGTDAESTNPSLTVFEGNFYADKNGNVITPNTDFFKDCKSVAQGLTEKVTHSKIEDIHFYKISFDLNGGTYTGKFVELYTELTEEIKLPTPIRKNYNFLGWYEDQTKYETIDGSMKTDISLKAMWEFDNSQYIEFNAVLNGGNWYYDSYESVAQDLLDDYNTYKGTNYTRSNLDLGVWSLGDFHTFFYSTINDVKMSEKWAWLAGYLGEVGGALNKKCCSLLLEKGSATEFYNVDKNYIWGVSYEFRGFIIGKQYTSNPTWLSADWSLSELQAGIWEPLNKSQSATGTAVCGDLDSLPTPKRQYYTFIGWYLSSDLNDENAVDSSQLVDGVTLYAKWKETTPVTSVEISNKINELALKGTYTLTWTTFPLNAGNKVVTFKSSNSNVITVNSKGELVAVGIGTATITITSTSNSAAIDTLTVVVYAPSRLDASFESESYVNIDDSIIINAKFISRDGDPEYTLNWSSSDKTIATVDENGIVTGKRAGNVVITVKTTVDGVEYSMDIDVTVLSNDLSDIMQLIVNAHNSNVYVTEQMLIALSYRTDIIGSVSDILYNYDYTVDESIKITGSNRSNKKMSSVEFITVHYTAGASKGSDAEANATFFKNGGGGASIHYCTGNDGIYHTMPDDEVAYHAGDGTKTEFKWNASGVMVKADDPARPVVDVSSNGYFTINGQITTIKCPGGFDKNLNKNVQPNDVKNYFTLLGPGVDVFNGQYYIGSTWWCNDQVAEGRVSSLGGNLNSIGIETACNQGSDLWYTWAITAQLVARLMKQNNLAINRVVGHNFFSGKDCPQPLLENEGEIWWQFIEMVEAEYEIYTKYQDYTIKFVSNDTDILGDNGRIIDRPLYTTSVSYSVLINKDGKTQAIQLSSLVPGNYDCK